MDNPEESQLLSGEYRLRKMIEDDLRGVMRIEMESFPSPWTPLAFALELRHNEGADYRVLVSPESDIVGYTGVWHMQGMAQILRIAVDPCLNGRGLGSMMLYALCDHATAKGLERVMLEVRESNAAARAFYLACGFSQAGVLPGYYSNPDEAAIIMNKMLDPIAKTG